MAKRGILVVVVLVSMLCLVQAVFAQETNAQKEWTFMVYLNADNNLDSFGVKDVNEMEKIGSTDKINIIVLLDRENGTAKKLYITKDADSNNITSKVIEEMGVYDMGSYKNLVSFFEWGMKNYPAKHYALDIWNHGSGWNKSRSVGPIKGISYDDQSGNHITTPQLGEAMASIYQMLGRKLDIISMDACLMQMAEVTYEIKDYVEYCVASEETEPGDGYTYDYFLGPLAENPTMSARDFSKVMVQGYIKWYAGINQAATQSSVDLAQLGAFVAKFNALCDKMTAATADKAFVTAIKKTVLPSTQAFYYRTNKDLGHFLALVQKNVKDAEIQTLLTETIALYGAGQNPVVVENGAIGNMAKATGLAIYFPSSAPGSDYAALKFGKDCSWLNFLKKYFPAAASVQ